MNITLPYSEKDHLFRIRVVAGLAFHVYTESHVQILYCFATEFAAIGNIVLYRQLRAKIREQLNISPQLMWAIIEVLIEKGALTDNTNNHIQLAPELQKLNKPVKIKFLRA